MAVSNWVYPGRYNRQNLTGGKFHEAKKVMNNIQE